MADVVVWSQSPLSIYAQRRAGVRRRRADLRSGARRCAPATSSWAGRPGRRRRERAPAAVVPAPAASPAAPPGWLPGAGVRAAAPAADARWCDRTRADPHRRWPAHRRRRRDHAAAASSPLGAAGEVGCPTGARRIDGRGLWVTPGLIDAESQHRPGRRVPGEVLGRDPPDDTLRRRPGRFLGAGRPQPARGGHPGHPHRGGDLQRAGAHRAAWSRGRAPWCAWPASSVDEMLVRAPGGDLRLGGRDGRAAAYGARGGLLLRLRELFDDVRAVRAPARRLRAQPDAQGGRQPPGSRGVDPGGRAAAAPGHRGAAGRRTSRRRCGWRRDER